MTISELLPDGSSPRPAEADNIPCRLLRAAAWHSPCRGPLEAQLLPGPGDWRPAPHWGRCHWWSQRPVTTQSLETWEVKGQALSKVNEVEGSHSPAKGKKIQIFLMVFHLVTLALLGLLPASTRNIYNLVRAHMAEPEELQVCTAFPIGLLHCTRSSCESL